MSWPRRGVFTKEGPLPYAHSIDVQRGYLKPGRIVNVHIGTDTDGQRFVIWDGAEPLDGWASIQGKRLHETRPG